ncbi:hypothetical protein [Frankia sp. Cr1]|uniref:hypothetical protein n=1 Tax=Frankia sp. Cr1 TaxID=3073931 RepID=UPI002AD4AC96|nr:hypothetical protein [Frankia sp. Cr1]
MTASVDSVPTIRDLLEGPPTVPLWPTAAKALGIGRSVALDLAGRDEFPVPVIKLGRRWVVPTVPLLRVLGIEPDIGEGGAGAATPARAYTNQTPTKVQNDNTPPRTA